MSKPASDALFRHGFLLMAAAQAANVCNIIFHALMGRALPDAYSAFSAMLNLMLIISLPLEAVRTSAAHFAARVAMAGDRGAVRLLLRTWGVRLLLLSLPLTLGGLLARQPIAAFFHFPTSGPVVIAALTMPLLVLVPLLAGLLQGLQSFTWMSISMQGLSVMRLAAGAGVVFLLSRTAAGALVGHAAGIVCALLLGGWGLARLLRGAAPPRMDLRGTAGYLGRSLAMLCAFAILMMMDVLLVKHYVPGEAESFARAATIARSIIFLPMPIALAMFPKVVSSGGLTAGSRRIFWKALGLVGGLILLGVAACVALPALPLRILYGAASPESMHLVRLVVLAMTPLSIAYLLMNFEMAQHRFSALPALWLAAAVYGVAAYLWHDSAAHITGALTAAGAVAAVGLACGMPWRALLSKEERP